MGKKEEYEKETDRPTAAFDVNPVILAGEGIVLAKRIAEVEQGGKWSLPGGRVFRGETIEQALKRMAKLKTGVDIELLYTGNLNDSFLGIYDNPGRDPRNHVVGVAFLCKATGGNLKAGGNSERVEVCSELQARVLDFAFDHAEIVEDAFRVFGKRALV